MARNFRTSKGKKAATTGRMLCIDPSSGGSTKEGTKAVAGWALFENGKPLESGTISFPDGVYTENRVKAVYKKLEGLFEKSDLMVLEEIRGRNAHASLIQACGAIIAAVEWDEVFEVNVNTWKMVARHWGGYEKTDENDALYMGYAAIAISLGYSSKLNKAQKDEVLMKAKEIVYGSSEAGTESETESSTGKTKQTGRKSGIRKKRSREAKSGKGKRGRR